MPHHERVTVSGRVADVFAHRFILETAAGRMLVDLTPKGAERISLTPGARVTVEGERKPSEIKAASFTPEGGEAVTIQEGRGHGKDEGVADPELAWQAASGAGYTPLTAPRRKPKHWEVLGRDANGGIHELHVEFDGTLRKTKPADPAKWPEHAAAEAMPSGGDAGRPRAGPASRAVLPQSAALTSARRIISLPASGTPLNDVVAG